MGEKQGDRNGLRERQNCFRLCKVRTFDQRFLRLESPTYQIRLPVSFRSSPTSQKLANGLLRARPLLKKPHKGYPYLASILEACCKTYNCDEAPSPHLMNRQSHVVGKAYSRIPNLGWTLDCTDLSHASLVALSAS